MRVSIRFYEKRHCSIYKTGSYQIDGDDGSLATPESRAVAFERAYQMALQELTIRPKRIKPSTRLVWPPRDVEKAVMPDDEIEAR